ncbi:mitochondrial folate transporter/carrier-like, partial [Manduca sexta]|uniref:mitochondrial folate transporter/carrier-like n=1 Tax=Manduca sexta TaxID=7130 RepID=UPI001890A018
FQGFVPGMFGVSHGALQFMAYEEMKNRYNQYRNLPIDIKLTSLEYLTFAAVSKLLAAGATYPYQVVRARLQHRGARYRGAWHCVRDTWRYEGCRGFYKGLKPSLVRVVPATMVTFLTYENVSHYMLKRSELNASYAGT